jgi:hypothetical protein
VLPSHLRASQSELVADKVAGMAQAKKAGKIPPGRIFTSNDNYVVDGHHRWAVDVAQDLADGNADAPMDVRQVDMPILQILAAANAFAHDMGIKSKGTGAAQEGTRIDRGEIHTRLDWGRDLRNHVLATHKTAMKKSGRVEERGGTVGHFQEAASLHTQAAASFRQLSRVSQHNQEFAQAVAAERAAKAHDKVALVLRTTLHDNVYDEKERDALAAARIGVNDAVRKWGGSQAIRTGELDLRDWKKWHEEHPYIHHPRPSAHKPEPEEEPGHFPGSVFAPVPELAKGKHSYVEAHPELGAPGRTDIDFSHVAADPVTGHEIADLYDKAPTYDPAAQAAYDQLIKETHMQYLYLTQVLGVKVEVADHDPYKNVDELIHDITVNHHQYTLSTAATGGKLIIPETGKPIFTNEQNDEFRAVHDAFGHAASGRAFDRNGEAAAWASHMQMYSPLAGKAVSTETHARNSVLIYGRPDQKTGPAFAAQKVFLLPDQYTNVNDVLARSDDFQAMSDADNLYDQTHCHHTSQGRYLPDARSDDELETRDWAEWDAEHPWVKTGRMHQVGVVHRNVHYTGQVHEALDGTIRGAAIRTSVNGGGRFLVHGKFKSVEEAKNAVRKAIERDKVIMTPRPDRVVEPPPPPAAIGFPNIKIVGSSMTPPHQGGARIPTRPKQLAPIHRKKISSELTVVRGESDADPKVLWPSEHGSGRALERDDSDLKSGSTMVSLDIPPGVLPAVDNGVDDHHITIVYAGQTTPEQYQAILTAAAQLAAATPPLHGVLSGIGTFPPSESSDWKTPVWVQPTIEGIDALRPPLEQFNASQHQDFHPHATLTYLGEGEEMPDPVPPTPITFTHLSVHRQGSEPQRYAFNGTRIVPGELDVRSWAVFDALRPHHPRDKKGVTEAAESPHVPLGPGAWKPVMSPEEAEAWLAAHQSKVTRPLFHGSPIPGAVAGIKRSGFRTRPTISQTLNANTYGQGAYFTSSNKLAWVYAGGTPNGVLETRIAVEHPATLGESNDILKTVKARKPATPQEASVMIRELAESRGFDAIQTEYYDNRMGPLENAATNWVVFDPHKIVVVQK